MARVELITRVGCHLCDEARDVIASVCEYHAISWQTTDVDTDPELAARYSDHVPVVLVDGVVVSYWFVDADQLISALEASSQRGEAR